MAENSKQSTKPGITQNQLDIHRVIVLWLFLATLIVSAIISIALIYSDLTGKQILTILPVVVVAGVLGSFVSALNRIYSVFDVFPNHRYITLLKEADVYLIAYSSIPPLIGAISAAILYVIFAGQIITGPFFPEFSCKCESGCDQFQTFLSYWSPKDAVDYAKAVVWGFISGFSERFVPDIINRVATHPNDES